MILREIITGIIGSRHDFLLVKTEISLVKTEMDELETCVAWVCR